MITEDWIEKNILCPVCHGDVKKADGFFVYVCQKCNNQYPLYEHQFPVFIAGYGEHLKKINKKIKENSSWFQKSQLDYYNNGPYHVHLARRKQYMQPWVEVAVSNTAISHVLDLGCGDGVNLDPESI